MYCMSTRNWREIIMRTWEYNRTIYANANIKSDWKYVISYISLAK